MKKFLSSFIVLWATWIIFSGINIVDIIIGGLVALILSKLIGEYVSFIFDGSFIVKLFKFIFVYLPIFIYELIVANVDVAKRVLNPSLPINPGFIKVRTDIKGDYGKLILANSITLTPGTLAVDVDDECIYIHWIDVKGENNEEYQKNISSSFEKVLGGIFN